jgi:hypothetical protein
MEEKTGKVKPNATIVKIDELLQSAMKDRPKLFAKVPEQKVAGIVRAALIQLGQKLDSMTDGVVKVPGFGIFRIQQVEREKEGKKVTVRKVAFKAAAPKLKKGKAAGKKG